MTLLSPLRLVDDGGQLIAEAGQPPPAARHPVGPDGLFLQLDVPPDWPDEVEVVSATLTLSAAPSDELRDLVPELPEATVFTDAGVVPFEAGAAPDRAWSPDPVRTLGIDLRARRIVRELLVTSEDPSRHARLKVALGGVFFPPPSVPHLPVGHVPPAGQTPVGTVEITRIPALEAERLLFEFITVDPQGREADKPLVLERVEVRIAKTLSSVEVAFEDELPFFRDRGVLDEDRRVAVPRLDRVLDSALRRLERPRLPLIVTSRTPGELVVVGFEVTAGARIRAFGERARTATLRLPFDGETAQPLGVPATGTLHRLELEVDADLRPETALRAPAEGSVPDGAQLCDRRHACAQAFAPVPESSPVTSIDLFVRPTTRRVAGTVAVYPDRDGAPDSAPISRHPFVLETADPLPAPPRWLETTVAPLRLHEGRWWVVLLVEEGALRWTVRREPGARPVGLDGQLLARTEAGPWLPRVVPAAGPAGARTPSLDRFRAAVRLRTPSLGAPPPVRYAVRRGAAEVPLTPDAAGVGRLDASALQPLNASDVLSAPVELVARTIAPGTLRLSGLELVVI